MWWHHKTNKIRVSGCHRSARGFKTDVSPAARSCLGRCTLVVCGASGRTPAAILSSPLPRHRVEPVHWHLMLVCLLLAARRTHGNNRHSTDLHVRMERVWPLEWPHPRPLRCIGQQADPAAIGTCMHAEISDHPVGLSTPWSRCELGAVSMSAGPAVLQGCFT